METCETQIKEQEPHAENVQLPLTRSAIIARAAAGLGMTVSEYLNKTFGDVLPEPSTDGKEVK